MSLITLKCTFTAQSVSATKQQQTNGQILFGKNAAVILKRLDELVKIKELDTSKLEAVLDMLKDADATTAFAKKAAGKNLVTAIKNLYKAKTLVATVNALRAIKIKPAAANAVATVKKSAAKTREKVVAANVASKAKMPKSYKVAELRRMTHAQRVAFTKKLNLVLGLDSLLYGIDNRGESFKSNPGDEWEMEGHVGTQNVHITFDGPYDNDQTGKWRVTIGDDKADESFDPNEFDTMRAFIHKNK